MKRILRLVLLAAVAAFVACAPREQTLVILSTNDMHAQIQHFPRLATAVAMCRDTAQVVLVDAGDRWTGNAYVDLAQMPGQPIIALMNRLGYDVGTLGNHEFDHGQAFLGRMIDSMEFEVIVANVISDTCTFPQLPASTIVERGGLRIGLVGVVTNYEGPGHPAGTEDSFVGLRFPDPQQAAAEAGAALRPQCDVLVLLSHMGDDRDMEFLEAARQPYDVIVGGHTHKEIDTLINGVRLEQTGKYLKNIGATVVTFRGKKIERIEYRIIPLADYAPDAGYQQLVDAYYAAPELNKPVGEFANPADMWGLANWMAEAVKELTDAEIGIVHRGGVRLDSIPAGGVSRARIFDLEPFGSHVVKMKMTPAQLRTMILSKYNDPINKKEAHRLDLLATEPYVLVTDAKDNATDVLFPTLVEGRQYRIGVSDYIFRTYKDMSYEDAESEEDEKIADELLEQLREHSPLGMKNTPLQSVRRK